MKSTRVLSMLRASGLAVVLPFLLLFLIFVATVPTTSQSAPVRAAGRPDVATAAADLFASTTGSGTLCVQMQPCTLDTALAQASAEDTIYVAGGTYTGTGGAVITPTAGSPARDAGATVTVTTDFDGDPRPIDGYDIGADEYIVSSYIMGTVTNATAQTLTGMLVSAGDYDEVLGCQPGPYVEEVLSTGPYSGYYSLEVPPGTYLVYANSHGHPGGYVPEAYQDVNSWSQIGAATPVTVAAGETVTGIDLSLPDGFVVSGRLVDDGGQPVLGAGGNMYDAAQDLEFGCALGFGSSPADGTFQVNVPAGSYNLFFGTETEEYVVRHGLVITQDTDLGDVLFTQDVTSGPIFDPRVLEPGYQVETVVPGGPNTPSDLAVFPDGRLYLAPIRSWAVYRVGSGSTLTAAAAVGVYALDAGSDGNLYGYFFPSDPGQVYRITPQGDVTTVGDVPQTSCESTMAIAPNLDIWIGFNSCGGTGFGDSRLYRLTQAGQLFTVTTGLTFGIGGLDFDASGQLYMTMDNELYHVDTSDGARTLVATLPGGASFHGLVIDPAGNFYVSGQDSTTEHIFKVTPGGVVSTQATLPDGCVQGLDRLPDGDLVATMRCTGALYRIHPDGTRETVLPGNGLATPQAMAFSPDGELFVVNDESGRVVRISHGRGEFFARLITFIAPLGHLAFEPSGDFIFSEAAPGFTPRLVRVSPQGDVTEVTQDVNWPSGLAFTPDGTLYVAEYQSGEVSAVSAAGQVTTLASGLTEPQSMAADDAGNLYVATSSPSRRALATADSNRIYKIDPTGTPELLASLSVSDLAFSAGGELFVTGPVGGQTGILRVAPDGSVIPFAEGFLTSLGLAFDLEGNMYVSDDQHNSITRITGFPQGTLQGTVSDAQTGLPIAGAQISVLSGYPVIVGAQVTTESDGSYQLTAAPRAYDVIASAPGYQSDTQTTTVPADSTVTVNFSLAAGVRVYLPLVLK
jgi:sugar lactone lactonase YvrE